MASARLQQLLEDAVAHHGAGRLDQAEKLYRLARADAPGHFDVLFLSGTLAFQQGRHAAAAELLSAALPLNARSAVCALRLANALAALGRLPEAEEHLRLALRRQHDLPEAWDRLGSVLQAEGRLAEAVPCHERAVSLKPKNAEGWHQLGLALRCAGRLTEALAAHDRALTLAPQQARFHHGRALALLQAHRLEDAVAACDAALANEPALADARSTRLLALSFGSGLSREELFAEHRAYGALFPTPPDLAPTDESPGRRLRVAFLTTDLRANAVTCFLEPLLHHLDRTGFEAVLYHDQNLEDETSRRLQSRAALCRKFAGLSHDAVAAVIRADAPDILVELAGHTGPNRLSLLARRVAPLQISYLGYPESTGLAAIDYRFTDEMSNPSGATDNWHTEQLVRLAPSAWTYQPPSEAPVVSTPPSAARGHVTFGCFNLFSLVNDETLSAWANLLGDVTGSHLKLEVSGLSDPAVESWARSRLTRLRVSEHRVELFDRMPGAGAHLAQYGGVDIALDTFPCHGTASTCEALWMGVPVVTLAGGHHAARVGASLLTALGRREWIARDWNGYARIAAGLARHPDELARLRQVLRSELQQSVLFDHAGLAARFGAALRECWQTRVSRVPVLNFA